MSKSYWLTDDEQKGNFSNEKQDTFDPAKGYVGVRLQQGVPLLDRDWNELEDIRRYEDVMLRKHYIGNGSPDNGFKISVTDTPSNDFKILAGRCIVEGFEVVNNTEILYSQQEGFSALIPPVANRTDTVYLDVWIKEVNKDGDTDLGNPNDVKMETCIRHKIEWRVRVDEGSVGHLPPDQYHHYYDIARIKWNGGEIVEAIDLRTIKLTLALVRNELEKIRHATVDSWVEGGDINWTGPTNNVYQFEIAPMTCIIKGREISFSKQIKVATILQGGKYGVLATSDGGIIFMDASNMSLGRWLYEWVTYRSDITNIKYIPLYFFERRIGQTTLIKTDLREGGVIDALSEAIEEIDKRTAIFTGEKHLYISPVINKIGTNPEWLGYLSYAFKPASTTTNDAYGMIPINLPSGAKMTKIRAFGSVSTANSLSLGLYVRPVNSYIGGSFILWMYPLGTPFDSSQQAPDINITNPLYYIYASAFGTAEVELFGFDITYVF